MKNETFNSERVGMFTSSSICNLMAKGKKKRCVFIKINGERVLAVLDSSSHAYKTYGVGHEVYQSSCKPENKYSPEDYEFDGVFEENDKCYLGKPFYTYCNKKAYEKIANRPLDNVSIANATEWGKLCEIEAFALLPIDYAFQAENRYTHPLYRWSGCPDYTTDDTVGDIKCPFTLVSAFAMHMCKTQEDLKKQYPQYYWQLVSNSILCDKKYAELAIFAPKSSRFKSINARASNNDSIIRFKNMNELPFLPEDSNFPEITTMRFEVPKEDKEDLTSRVICGQEHVDLILQEFN